MLSKITDSNANKKMMGDKKSVKMTEATSVIESPAEQGEGELEVDDTTPVRTSGCHLDRGWACFSIA